MLVVTEEVQGETGQEATPWIWGVGGAFLSDLPGNLGAQSLSPGYWKPTSEQLLSGLDPVPALPQGCPGIRD